MKKIIALLGFIIAVAPVSLASIDEDKTGNIELLRQQGYSESTLKVLDTNRSQTQRSNYKRQFARKGQTPYHYIKTYLDPYQDDNYFGEHQINFTNSWNDDETHYTSGKYSVNDNRIEDL